MSHDKLLKPYDPTETEERIYKTWEKSGFFDPDTCIKKGITKANAETFSMVLPPPNVTGILHMGHALMVTVQDIMVRYARMQGKRTLWIPGTDHAAIATQARVEKDISKTEGKNRFQLGREEFLKRVEKFAQESHDTIVSQVKRIGASADWSREAFTLDGPRSLAVRTAFKKMYDDGLIYRGNRIVNWDPKGQTTVSDDEVVHEERKGKLYTFRYSKDFPIPISTTRPETKVGDVAVAVHPDDARYKQYIGKAYEINFAGVPLSIKVVADKAAEMEFGTGAVGVTPAHSVTDAEIAEQHNLPSVQVIDEHAKMLVGTPELMGKKVLEAREIVVTWLREQNLLEKEEEITQNVSIAERTGGTIEPLPKLQWFIAVNKEFTDKHGQKTTLKKIMREAVESGKISIMPDYFSKTYFNWIDNLRDWCISRQIWYGHRIPVWYKAGKDAAAEVYVGIEAPSKHPEKDDWVQDEDTLDTWFSSGLWTFSTLGWPDEKEMAKQHFAEYHPTNVLETGYEILFFWVARMILMSGYLLGDIPFKQIYLHGTVRDAKGRKMSKSLGNGIDPIEIANKFGADAGRMALIAGTGPGTDSKIDENKIKGYKHFANKIWNIARFVVTHAPENIPEKNLKRTEADLELIAECKREIFTITEDMNKQMYHLAAEKIYHYIWNRFADEIIEESKKDMSDSRKQTLRDILSMSLVTLHPFMPFVTEELWGIMGNKNLLMVEPWPERASEKD